jgi:membrane-bound metal-dependent hydrolase YbcI (DUF457 family)
MNTQSHALMGALLFGRPLPRHALVAALGGIAPDIPMFAIVFGLRVSGHPPQEIFGKLYWERWWQVCNAIGHSFILWGLLAAAFAVIIRRPGTAKAPGASLAFAFSASALVHSAIDFLVHREDAHMQFWPLSDWKFVSPVSYWDPNHYGAQFSLFEAALGLVMAVLLFRRCSSRSARAALSMCALLYLAVPAFFIFGM